MPRRKRESKRRHELTIERNLLLTIGPTPVLPGQWSDQLPRPGSDRHEALRACWFANRESLICDEPPERNWGYRVFELGHPYVAPELEPVARLG